MNIKAIDLYLQKLKNGVKDHERIDDADLADYLEDVKQKDEDKFFEYLNSLPLKIRAETFIELPTPFQIDLILKYDAKGLADIIEVLDSDDATDLFIAITKTDKEKEESIFSLLSDTKQKTIEKLISYESNEAGSLMQTEILKVSNFRTIAYAIEKLGKLKEKGIGTVQSVFVTDNTGRLIKSISIDDLILEKTDKTFDEILEKYPESYSVISHDSVDNVVNIIEKYDLTTLAVVDRKGHLIGRITHDDVIDIMQKRATQQIYNLNKINADEHISEEFSKTSKTRAVWLTINLVNAIIASLVIGLFSHTIETIVALAVLMPIVANMAGTASVQTMTVVVRQMALGEIEFSDIKPIFIKEINIAAINGLLFGSLGAVMAYVRFENWLLSLSIALAMLISFLCAGVLAVVVPMVLKKVNLDPAVASSVVVLTLVDIVGFFSFLWLAQVIML